MEKEFVPYEQALALKELGFNKPCFRFKNNISNVFEQKIEGYNWNQVEKFVSIPTFSQAFRWFREKYGLIVCNDYGNYKYFYWIISKDEKIFFNNEDEEENTITFTTYEEAQLECLKKLIEIAKQKTSSTDQRITPAIKNKQ